MGEDAIIFPKFTDEIGELRAIFGHVLRATGVQIPEDDLDNLHSLREVDGTLVFVDPQDLLGFLEYTKLTTGLGDSNFRTIGFLEGTSLVVIKDKLKAARYRHKSYADKRRKPLEFSVGDYVLLKVSPWKGVVRFGKKGKLAPRFVGPFKIIEKVGPVAYQLDFLEVLNDAHDTFHMSNLKKCLADPTLQVSLDEIRVDSKLNFVE
ncbi:hypothetical protein Tco_0938507 [Tanacetum coccineum]|uniref:Tf2-1-like SH3-like domain-containing protein n=1 Tax=Tanacetum coccineum TaxID=301880 RepID=A0ABQ5DJW8_9ASTR